MKMGRQVHQSLHVSMQFSYSKSLKIVTRLFLSLSVVSFFFSYSSFPSFLRSINFFFSTFPYQLFTHTIDKNCMFLICNGILVFVAKFSGLVRSFSLSSHQNKKEEIKVPESIICFEENIAMEEGREEEYYFTNQSKIEKEIVEDEEQKRENENMVIIKEEEDQEEEGETAIEYVVENEEMKNNWVIKYESIIEEQQQQQQQQQKEKEKEKEEEEEEEEEEEDNEEVGNGMLSTEELNKKFDEFIRKMKEELRIEAQRHLIMV